MTNQIMFKSQKLIIIIISQILIHISFKTKGKSLKREVCENSRPL